MIAKKKVKLTGVKRYYRKKLQEMFLKEALLLKEEKVRRVAAIVVDSKVKQLITNHSNKDTPLPNWSSISANQTGSNLLYGAVVLRSMAADTQPQWRIAARIRRNRTNIPSDEDTMVHTWILGSHPNP